MSDDDVVLRALCILKTRMNNQEILSNPKTVSAFLRLKIGESPREIFGGIFLDNKNRLIEYSELFFGSYDHAHIIQREVARKALTLNAASVIFFHNHPAGVADPSADDIAVTDKLKMCLKTFDVKVLDHIVVSAGSSCSMAAKGWL